MRLAWMPVAVVPLSLPEVVFALAALACALYAVVSLIRFYRDGSTFASGGGE